MSDHLIAEANRHASALPEDLSTVKSSILAEDIIKALSDIAWYVRECETLRSENADLLRKNSEWESERLQFANRAKKLHRLEEENTALVKAGNELAALLRDTGNPEDDRPTWESAEDAINRWQQARKEKQI